MQPAGRNLLQKTAELLSNANAGVICLPEKPSDDTIAAATALYMGLTKLGKNVSLACATEIKSDLFSADKIQTSLTTSGENLVISFPYTDGSIDRIDYFIQANKFNVVVAPGKGFEKLSSKDVSYGHAGGSVDFIVTVDAASLRALGALYEDNKDMFDGKKIINIGRNLTNTFFGSVNLVYRGITSTSEIVLNILKSLNCELDKEITANLYQGLSAATQKFSSAQVTAETFETAAFLMKQGAGKKEQPLKVNGKTQDLEKKTIRSADSVEKEPIGQEDNAEEDWLKPNIFSQDDTS